MRLLPLVVAAALLAGCPAPSATEPTTDANSQPTNTATQPTNDGATPAPAKLSGSSRLTIDGTAVTAFEATPSINFTGLPLDGKVSVSNAKNTVNDRSYSLDVRLNAIGAKNGLARDFKPADINRVYFDMEQFVSGKSRGNKWTGIFDVPSAKITASFTHEGDRIGGTLEMTLEPDGGNEAEYKKPVKVKYEFENAAKF